MKILISPAKSLDLETPIPVTNHSDLMFESAVKEVQQQLKSFKASELKSKMKISDKIAALNWERNQQFTWPMTDGESRQAVFAFNGDVYKGLDAYSLREEEIESMQEMLLILSGLYGMLKPLDLIQAYRLEMGTSMKVANATSLAAYWKPNASDHESYTLLCRVAFWFICEVRSKTRLPRYVSNCPGLETVV